MLAKVPEKIVTDPIYLEKDFSIDDSLVEQIRAALVDRAEPEVRIEGVEMGNRFKSVGGQLSIDLERMLNYELDADTVAALPAVVEDERGRRSLVDGSIVVTTQGSAGQSYGAFSNDGMRLEHTGTANDGVGKSQGGGTIVVLSPAAEVRSLARTCSSATSRSSEQRADARSCRVRPETGSRFATRAQRRLSRASATSAAST